MPKPKRPKDTNLRAKFIVDIATGEAREPVKAKSKRRLGGLKGGRARAKKLSASRRKEIAQKAAEARWKKSK